MKCKTKEKYENQMKTKSMMKQNRKEIENEKKTRRKRSEWDDWVNIEFTLNHFMDKSQFDKKQWTWNFYLRRKEKRKIIKCERGSRRREAKKRSH